VLDETSVLDAQSMDVETDDDHNAGLTYPISGSDVELSGSLIVVPAPAVLDETSVLDAQPMDVETDDDHNAGLTYHISGSDVELSDAITSNPGSPIVVPATAVLDETSVLGAQPMDVETDNDHNAGLTYHAVRAGSSKSKDLLTNSAGPSYTLKPTKNETTRYWRCVVRNKRTNCRATVIEDDDGYHPGHFAHICQTKRLTTWLNSFPNTCLLI